MAKLCPNSLHVLEGGEFVAAALEGAARVPELPKYMMKDRFSHKTGHIMYYKTNKNGQIALGRFLADFLNEFIPSFNSKCLLCARNCSEAGDTAARKTGVNSCPGGAWVVGSRGYFFC